MNGPDGYNIRFTKRYRGGGSTIVTLDVDCADSNVAWALARDLHLSGRAEVQIWKSGVQLGLCSSCGGEEIQSLLDKYGVCWIACAKQRVGA